MRAVVSRFGSGNFQQALEVGNDRFISDIAKDKGGDALGPSPHEYLGAALAACTGMTLKMYAKRKSWDLQDAIVTVDIERENEIEKFKRSIKLVGITDTEQSGRLLEIANKCPVHKALTGTIEINTELL
ncbi:MULTISPECIES: OsmC family protein [unclassified Polynucleobacter]|uniref:OsmC family protein n=1 Tax=unclassified Polynucleobacter TaxID=2640945 RepID=UPI002572B495|nr:MULTISPECIES: OsmC family protein [unclassified Polynucleobacter]BEI43414.1 OsmC family protein [Polynucleobacter sp. HIN10]BEI45191.1 OsmC family protein [Polynucleobacter sp. HIN11]